jgi:DNA-binding transcriptional MerR regulator
MAGMTIGQLSRRVGITPRAVRYYERIGLLTPSGRTASGYRLYTEAEVERLAFIRRAQAQCLSLADIALILATRDGGAAPCRQARALAESRLRDVNARIEELFAARQLLVSLISRAGQVEPFCAEAPGICLAFSPS